MMSRPMVLAFLLLILIITSQFEWKQQLVNDLDSSHSISDKQQQTMNKVEVVKEKIILSQEKNIQRLNKLVQSLQQQLVQCQGINKTATAYSSSLMTNINETDWLRAMED
uniref:Lon protease 1 n=1 Tax=Anthurium amnicola TaxID=1678845 RepID=A0A1D1YL72_9ARAE